MHWFDRSPAGLALYALAALLAIAEIVVLWQALHPRVSDAYRAYYIDRTTTCLPQPVTGAYTLGTEIDFTSKGEDTRELRPCGWEGPAGDGMHAVGESSRLRFAVSEQRDLVLMLELSGVTLDGATEQNVDVSVGDSVVGRAVLKPGQTRRFSFPVPAAAIVDGHADIELAYPDAISPRPGTANAYWRSIKLGAAALLPVR